MGLPVIMIVDKELANAQDKVRAAIGHVAEALGIPGITAEHVKIFATAQEAFTHVKYTRDETVAAAFIGEVSDKSALLISVLQSSTADDPYSLGPDIRWITSQPKPPGIELVNPGSDNTRNVFLTIRDAFSPSDIKQFITPALDTNLLDKHEHGIEYKSVVQTLYEGMRKIKKHHQRFGTGSPDGGMGGPS